jgi:two-component system KDP operon response regulator KdpE
MPAELRAKPSILVVDDEPQILRAVRAGLTAQGFDVQMAVDGVEALREATSRVPDMVVLDLMLPGEIDGFEICRRLREWTTVPILILSALGNEQQKVKALDLGADDYLTKPFGMDELTARVRAALRRSRTASAPAAQPPVFMSGSLTVDFARRIVTKCSEEVKLTPIEYDILRFLAQNPDRVVTHRQVLSAVWGGEYADDTQLIRVHIGHVRRKIEDDPARPRMIVTEPGVGYRFRTADDSA